MDKVIISPIFYMGNKKRLINKGLISLFPNNINTFIDLFSGSAIVSMNVKANKYIINDIDPHLQELYRLFKTKNQEKIINHIELRINQFNLPQERTKRNVFEDKEKIRKYKIYYSNFRKYYNNNKNTLDFYTLMFYSFSQQFRFNNKGDFNMPYGNDCFSDKNKTYIINGCNFFSQNNVFITSNDFRELKPCKLVKGDFVYIDPPYYNTTATYNENKGWNIDDELALYKLCEGLDKSHIKWAMSNIFLNKEITNNSLIRWVNKNNYQVYHFSDFTYTSCGKGNAKTDEVLITNY